MIRVDNYKLIVYPRAGVQRLYNLVDDPQEMNDISGLPAQQERLDDMFAKLVTLQSEMGDTLKLDDFNYVGIKKY